MCSYLVFYESTYGSTAEYATRLAHLLGVEAHQLSELSSKLAEVTPEDTTAVVLSPNYAGKVSGVKASKQLCAAGIAKLAVAAVGMTPLDVAKQKDVLADLLGDAANNIARFYLPGNLCYSKLSRLHRTVMWGMVTALKKKSNPTQVDRNMIDGYGKDTVAVDLDQLAPIVQWAKTA